MPKKFLLLLSCSLALLLWRAVPARAACYCQDPSVCRCSTTKTTPFSTTLNYNKAGAGKFQTSTSLKIYCDTQEEANSLDATRAPVCGSSPEVISTCARGPGPSEAYWTCWGSSVASGTMSTNLNPLPGPKGVKDYSFSGGFTFNGIARNAQGSVRVCADNVNCCGNINNCFAGDIPGTPTSCPDQNPSITPPADICGAVPSKDSQGSGESRLWFPHLRNISALATLLQSIFNPSPSSFNKNAEPPGPQSASLDNPAAVTTRITLHQGKDDDTPIVNQSDNNSSLRVNQPAPDPLYSFNDPSLPYKASGFCSIADTRVNPGDDLLGPKISARLTYTQKYQYQAAASENCFGDSAYVSEDQRKNCCSFKAAGIGSTQDGYFDPAKKEKRYVCGTLPGVREKTQGRIAVFTKTPLIEYIYNSLVVGPQSVLKRLFPFGNPKEFKEVVSEAKYVASAPGADQLAVGGQTGQTPTIYFPHVGSLYEYFLQGLQKALRPLGWTFSSSSPPTQSGDCNTVAAATTSAPACPSGGSLPFSSACGVNSELKSIIQEAGGAYGVPPAIIAGILSIETRNGVFSAPLNQNYLCQPNVCGAMGAMQLLTGYGVQSSCSQAIGVNRWAEYACKSGSENPNPGNLRDSIFAGAKMIKAVSGTAPAQNSNWSQAAVFQVAERYYGSCSQSFSLKTNIEYANSCLPVPPVIAENDMTYCDYLWYYYSPRR